MNSSGQPRSTLERSLALVVRYWAYNMTIIHDQGQDWPGFGYDSAEKDTLRTIAREVDAVEYFVWGGFLAVFFLAFAALIVMGAGLWLSAFAPKPASSAGTSDVFYIVAMSAQLVVALSVGFPLALLVASLGCGRFFSTADGALPDRPTTQHFIDKLVFQITRMAVLGGGVVLALLLFVPADSTIWLRLKLVMPILSTVVAALTLAYYASARLRRTAGGGG